MLGNIIAGFEKAAGAKTELVGAGSPIGSLTALGGMAAGPYSKDEQKKVDKKTWSNVLIPGVGGWRAGRRAAGAHPKKTEDSGSGDS